MRMKCGDMTGLWRGVAAAGFVALMAGCATPRGGLQPSASAQLPSDTSAERRGVAKAELSCLNVWVTARAEDDDAVVVATELRTAVVGNLAAGGLRLDESAPDVAIDLGVSVAVFDESGEFFVFDTKTKILAMAADEKRTVGTISMEARGERKLGRDAALRSAAAKLAEEVLPWVDKAISPESLGLVASEVSVRGSWWQTREAVAEYAGIFVAAVGGWPGVASCRVVEQDVADKRIVFRVVHKRDAFAEGLLNRLSIMQELNLRPLGGER